MNVVFKVHNCTIFQEKINKIGEFVLVPRINFNVFLIKTLNE